MESKPKKQKPEPGPELPTDDSQAGVTYISFDELQPAGEGAQLNEEFIQAVMEQSHSEDWKAQYDAVNQLRVLNKFQPELLVANLPNVAEFIKGQIDNLRSNLMKNSLLFLKEFCSFSRITQDGSERERIGPFIRIVMPTVLVKTTYEKNFIASEAKESLKYAVTNTPYPELVDILVEGCQAKNIVLAEYSIGYLSDISKKLPQAYFLSGEESPKRFIRQMGREIRGKRMKMKKGAEAIVKDIINKVGVELISKLLIGEPDEQSDQFSKEQADEILKVCSQKDTKKADKSHDFRSFLKQQKQQAVKEDGLLPE